LKKMDATCLEKGFATNEKNRYNVRGIRAEKDDLRGAK